MSRGKPRVFDSSEVGKSSDESRNVSGSEIVPSEVIRASSVGSLEVSLGSGERAVDSVKQ